MGMNFNINIITYLLSPILIFAMVMGIAIFLTRKFHSGWRLIGIGCASFIISQIGHIPFNYLVLNPLLNDRILPAMPSGWNLAVTAIAVGLSAGLFEELTRYAVARWWAKDARSWSKGLLLGAGHGGIEAILVAAVILVTYVQLMALRSIDLATVIPPEQLDLARQQVETYWSAPWYDTLLGAVERAFTLPVQLCFSVLVMQALVRKQGWWLGAAILWHTIVDAVAVMAVQKVGIYWTEALVGVFALISIVIIILLRKPDPPEPKIELAPPSPPLTADDLQPIA